MPVFKFQRRHFVTMVISLRILAMAGMLMSVMVSPVNAGSISLYDTSGATPKPIAYSIPGYAGQSTFSNILTDYNGATIAALNLAVDYAVFAPGEFSNSAFGHVPGATNSDGTFSIGDFSASSQDYVYAYQIFNLSSSTTGLLGLSIGFNPLLPSKVDDSEGEANANNASNAVAYSSVFVESDATLFSYYPSMQNPDAPPINPGQESYFLFTSSTYSPYYTGSLAYGTYTTNVGGTVRYISSPNSDIPVAGAVGVPTPLPQTWKQLVLLAVIGLIGYRIKVRRTTHLVPVSIK